MSPPQAPLEAQSSTSQTSNFIINPVRTPADITTTAGLFTQYTSSLNLDLSFQDYATELASLPGKYSPSRGGELLLARDKSTGEAVGVIALRALDAKDDAEEVAITKDERQDEESTTTSTPKRKIAELKRLYVSPSTRGTGLGRLLTMRMIAIARELGYNEIKLDTLSSMTAAQKMYESLGFRDVEPYYHNPIEGVRFLGLRLEYSLD